MFIKHLNGLNRELDVCSKERELDHSVIDYVWSDKWVCVYLHFPIHNRDRRATRYYPNRLSMQRHGTYSVPLAFQRPAWATNAIDAAAAWHSEADMFEGDRLNGCATHRPFLPNSIDEWALRCLRTSSATTIGAHAAYCIATASIHCAKRAMHPKHGRPPNTPSIFVPKPKISFPVVNEKWAPTAKDEEKKKKKQDGQRVHASMWIVSLKLKIFTTKFVCLRSIMVCNSCK